MVGLTLLRLMPFSSFVAFILSAREGYSSRLLGANQVLTVFVSVECIMMSPLSIAISRGF